MIALILFCLILAPAYVIHFSISHYPTNLLMMWVFIVWVIFAVWIIYKKLIHDFTVFIKSIDKRLFIPTALFLLAGIVSLFYPHIDQKKLGQFIVLFLQPISLFFITGFILSRNPKFKFQISNFLYLVLGVCGLFAVIQYFTRLGLPSVYWGNANEPKRALSFFVHPNFYALFSAPLLAFLIPDIISSIKANSYKLKAIAWIIGGIGLVLSLSRGGWLGLAVAAAAFVFIAADKKVKLWSIAAVIVIFIIILITPVLRYRLVLPFMGEKSSVSRFSLVHTGWKMVKDSPILGKGLMGFDRNFNTYNTDPGLDHLDFPHNIFLNFWIDTGLLGLISFFGILFYALWRGFKHPNNIYALGFALFCIALFFHGLIDVPYLKNDLAVLFWILLATVL